MRPPTETFQSELTRALIVIRGGKCADWCVDAARRIGAEKTDGRVFGLFCMTADIGPICIDESADHPTRCKLIIVSPLRCEKAASASKLTEARIVILVDLSQNCPLGTVH